MAALTGVVEIQHNGRDLRLVLDFNALCEFETLTSKNALRVLDGAGSIDMSASDARALVCAAMRRHQQEATLAEAGDVLSQAPDVLVQILSASQPSGDAGNGKRPPRARAK